MSTSNLNPDSSGPNESEEDSQVVRTSRKKKRCIESEDELSDVAEGKITPYSNVQTTAQRSSERIRNRLQRQYVLPSREEILDKIDVKNVKYENMSLKPRRSLVNDFVKGSSRYVMDKVNIVESDTDLSSDFIDDSETTASKKCSRRSSSTKKRRNIGKEFDKCIADDTESVSKKTRKKVTRKTSKQLSSDDEGTSEQNNDSSEVSAPKKSRKQKQMKTIESTSDEEMDSEKHVVNCKIGGCKRVTGQKYTSEEEDCDDLQMSRKHSVSNRIESSDSDEMSEQNFKLPKRTKSAKKEKEKAILQKLTAKRKMDKLKVEKKIERQGTDSDTENMIEESQHDSVPESVDVFEVRESDDEFIVDDEYCEEIFNEEGINNADNMLDGDVLKPKQKKSNVYQRIYIPVESDESDNETVVESTLLKACKAVKANNLEDVRSILETNPDIVNDFAQKRRTLLHYAVISGTAEITKFLLDSGADKLAVDSHSLQPLAYAILTGHIDCLQLLLDGSCLLELDKKCKIDFDFNLLHFVVQGNITLGDLKCKFTDDIGLVQCLKKIFKHDKHLFLMLLNGKDSQGFTPLVAAIIAGHYRCIEYLLQSGASVDDFHSKNGGNLLHFAIEHCLKSMEVDTVSCLNVLLQSSLAHKVDQMDHSGFTPLMYAAQSGDHECVLALLEAGASVTCKDLHGTTSLHLAAASGDTQSVKLLLQYGHQVDCLDSCGWPPLLYANFAAQESCVLSLMEPNPKQIFVLGDLLKRGTSEAAKERNFKVVKDVLLALANQDAYYRVFNDFIRRNPNFLDEYDRGLLNKTWRALLDYDNKHQWFKRKLANLRKDPCNDMPLEVDRQAVFESAMTKLGRFSGSFLRKCRLNITFKNEEGICSGPKKEFFVNICKDIVDERRKLFHLTDDNQYSFVPNAHFAEIAKIQGGPVENKIDNERGDKICTSFETDDMNHSSFNELSSTVDPGLSVDTTTGRTEDIEDTNLHTDEIGDTTITDLHPTDTNPSAFVNSSQNIESNNSTDVQVVMDDTEDTIIAELDISEFDSCLENSQAKGKMNQNPTLTDEIKRQEFARHVEQKLSKNMLQLHFLGKIIGTAICHGVFVNLNLCKPLVKQILGIPLSHPDDLGSFDYKLHKNLVTFVLQSDDVDELELPCTLDVINPWNERLTSLKLFSDERNEEMLNKNNKAEYVELVSQYKLTVLIEKEIDTVCQGLNEVIPKSLFSLFTADEFSLLINGIGKIDVEDWRQNTVYTPEDAEDSCNEIKWFWEVVNKLKEEEKALLLKFSTGSPCLPAGGFAHLQGLGGNTKFHISMKSERNKIPTASTCFNLLKIPQYDNLKDLRDKLLIAIRHGTEGFSFS